MTNARLAGETMSSSLTKSLVRGGGISFVGQFVQATMNVLFQWYMARTLGAAGVGVYTLAFSIVSLAVLFATLGLERGIIKFVAHYNALGQSEHAKGVVVAAFWIYGVFSLFVSLGLFLGAEQINQHFFQEPALTQVMRWMTLLLVATGWVSLLVSVPVAYRRVEYQAIAQNILLPVTSLVLATLFVFVVGKDLYAFVYAAVVAAVLAAVVAFWRLVRFQPFRDLLSHRADFATRKLLSFSGPIFFTQLLNRTEGQLSFLFLGALAATSDVGIYRVGSRLTLPMTMMLSALLPIFSPIIASLYAKEEIKELGQLYRTTTRWLLMAGLPVFLVIVLVPGELLGLFGEEFAVAATVLRLIALAQLVNVATGPVGMVLQMTKYVTLNFMNAVLILIVTIVLQLWLIPRYGLLGSAAADTIAIGLLNLVRILQVFILLRIHPLDRSSLNPFLAALPAAGVCLWLLQFLPAAPLARISIIAFVAVAIYALTLWFLKIDEADKQLLATVSRSFGRRVK